LGHFEVSKPRISQKKSRGPIIPRLSNSLSSTYR
jgi:hypothetical protein